MLKQETHPKKKWKGMAENTQEERRIPPRFTPIIDIEPQMNTLTNFRDENSLRSNTELGGEIDTIIDDHIQRNETNGFHSSTSSAFRPVAQIQKDGRNKERKTTSEKYSWGIKKILASPNLELEAKQANGEYKSIKNDNPRPIQYTKPNTNLPYDPKEAYSRLKFPNEDRNAKIPPFANPFSPYYSFLYHYTNTIFPFPPPSLLPMSQHLPPLNVPQPDNSKSISQRMTQRAIFPPLPNRNSLSSQGSQSSSFDESINISNESPTELALARNKRRQNKLIPEDCPFSYEQVVEQVIDDFNQMLEDYRTKEGHPLSEDKKSEYRDLRRRGKNRVAARDSREKKILKTKDLKHRKSYLTQKLSRILHLKRIIPKLRRKKDLHLTKAIERKKITYQEFNSRFPRHNYVNPILPIPGRIT